MVRKGYIFITLLFVSPLFGDETSTFKKITGACIGFFSKISNSEPPGPPYPPDWDKADPIVDEYIRKYVHDPKLSYTASHAFARAQLLQRLGMLKKLPRKPQLPYYTGEVDVAQTWGDRGYRKLAKDQYGDRYGTNNMRHSTLPELSRFFNIPQPQFSTHPNADKWWGRFLREAENNFPRDRLTNEELYLLEPLPQRDPLYSYIGNSLIKLLYDNEKPMKPYHDPKEKFKFENDNYFRRKDGTYYIFDFQGGHHGDERAKTDTLHNMLKAIESSGTRKQNAINFLLDSIFIIEHVTNREAANMYRYPFYLQHEYTWDNETIRLFRKGFQERLRKQEGK